jgi:hypothetical protein
MKPPFQLAQGRRLEPQIDKLVAGLIAPLAGGPELATNRAMITCPRWCTPASTAVQ